AQAGAVAKASTATAASINLGAVMVILLGRPVEPFGAFRLAHGGGRLLTPLVSPVPWLRSLSAIKQDHICRTLGPSIAARTWPGAKSTLPAWPS
ncbi:MAG TPA: hypothetical protein VL147_18750, partial [Devosia sp.]|nr:hypothetical protein [Devosia sp.]